MTEQNQQIIETIDEEGNKVCFEVIDFVTVDDIEYALLIPEGADDEEETEVLVARVKKNGDEDFFELIEGDEEFEKVAQYIAEIEDELEDE